jgi:chromosome segregation ATPase
MKRLVGAFILTAAGVAAGAAVQGGPYAEAAQNAQGQDILPALLVEVRGLRAAMEQMASSGPRVQLALGRLQLQEQRVNNLLRRLETTRGSLAGAQREEEQSRQQFAAMEEMLKSPLPEGGPQRANVEQDMGHIKQMSARLAAEVQRLQVEESDAVQELAVEQGRWTEINQRMEELERALTRK